MRPVCRAGRKPSWEVVTPGFEPPSAELLANVTVAKVREVRFFFPYQQTEAKLNTQYLERRLATHRSPRGPQTVDRM